ncbi:hypothetical protein KAR91_83465 [Candidatus Pacearchaeota archaeon]|nr:hypothetical protein [Candidatus Pacearchaeota archaeon]
MALRDNLMRQFGPMLLEAFGTIIFNEINEIRTHVGLPARTWEQFFNEINNHTSTLEPYDWMQEGP